MKKLVIFDLDGTLADTSGGILWCYGEAARRMGLLPAEQERYEGVIGGQVDAGFQKVCGMNPADSEKAAQLYRELYVQKRIFMARLYDGIEACLRDLKACGCLIALATLKHERFAGKMLENLHILRYFDGLCAYDGTPECRKASLLEKACRILSIEKEDSLLVGDSLFDAQGAALAGVDFLAVTYGLGFHSRSQADAYPRVGCVASPAEIFPQIAALPEK